MAKQLNSDYNEVSIPFQKMNFVPDVPTAALGPNEYNDGLNVESDVRGIRSVAGDLAILTTCPGTPTFITGGFRVSNEFWFIVATTEGIWWATNGTTQDWYDITPGGTPIIGYTQSTNITEAWNGTVPFFNDSLNPPMFLPEPTDAIPLPTLIMYTNALPQDIGDISYLNPTTQRLTILNQFTATGCTISGTVLTIGTLTSGAVAAGEYITGTGITSGTKIISNISDSGSGSTWYVNYSQTFSGNLTGSAWDTPPYNANDQILISDVNNYYNGTFTVVDSTTTTIDYLAVPGAGYPASPKGTVSPLYAWNYNPNWKSYYANFMRLYSTPNVGSILVAGNLTVTNNDDLETVDIYPVTVQWSQNFGLNQAPKTWQPTVTNVANQLEVPLRGPALDAFPSNGQFFLCSYWDTVVFSPINYSTTSAPILGVRLYNQGRGLLSSNCWANTDKLVYGVDARDIWVFDGTDFQGLGNQQVKNWFFDQLDPAYYDTVFMEVNSQKNQVEIYYYTQNGALETDAVGVPNRMLSYRYDLSVWNAPRVISSATFSCESPIWTLNDSDEWEPNLGSRTIVYARGKTDEKLVQKDYGYEINDEAIYSYFKRSNIKLLKDYSGKLMVHRLLPEAINIGGIPFTGDYNKQLSESTGNISIQIDGAESVGQLPVETTQIDMQLNTSNPWVQPNQNSHRINTITIENTSNTNIWMTTATTWQYSQVEDDR